MRIKSYFKKALSALGLLATLNSPSMIIDFPIDDWHQPSLQLAYDKAKDGDTIHFRRVSGNRIYSGTLVADEDKTVTIDADMFGWRVDTPIEVNAGTLTIMNHPLFYPIGRTIDVIGKGNLLLDSVHFMWGDGVNISTSGIVELRDCWATQGGSPIVLEKLVNGGKLVVSRCDFQQQSDSIVFGEEEPNANYTIQVNNNSFYDVNSPFKFTSQLKTTTGLIANNTITQYIDYARNTDYAKGVKIISNNYYNLLQSGFGELEQSLLSESLGDIGNNYSFDPRFEDGEGNLSADSELIDRGVFIDGLFYNGTAPDISRVESPYTRGTTPEPTTITLLGLAGILNRRKR